LTITAIRVKHSNHIVKASFAPPSPTERLTIPAVGQSARSLSFPPLIPITAEEQTPYARASRWASATMMTAAQHMDLDGVEASQELYPASALS